MSDRPGAPDAVSPEDASAEGASSPGDAALANGASTAARPADPAPAGASPPVTHAVEPPSPDVALADEASPLPGAHRGGFQRLPTAPVDVTAVYPPADLGAAGAPEPELRWLMPEPAAPHRGLAIWALAFSIAGLLVSLFVGWGFPIGLVGVLSGILALRRPFENRSVAIWAVVLGTVSVLYSTGWLLYAASRVNLLG